MLNTLLKKIKGLGIDQLTNMLREVGFLVTHNTKGVFHLSATGKDIICGVIKQNRNRRISPTAAQQTHLPVHNPCHRIIDPGDNFAVMEQKKIRQACQLLQCLIIVCTDRLSAPVTAGHDQYLRSLGLTE